MKYFRASDYAEISYLVPTVPSSRLADRELMAAPVDPSLERCQVRRVLRYHDNLIQEGCS
jgi:hypothetical protein